MADLNNNEYLRFDASSMQQLLRRKLTENGYYTDQMYPGSDIKMVMDIFSWTFNCLTYMLNNTANESMFDSAVVYEHLNKLTKLLSYKPRGYITSNCTFNLSVNQLDGSNISGVINIPKFSSINLGGVDKYGYVIRYTFLDDYQFKVDDGQIVMLSSTEYPILYNGFISKYSTEFNTTGIKNEQFTVELSLDDQSQNNSSTLSNPYLIVDEQIFIYLQHYDKTTSEYSYTELKKVNDLYFEGSAIEYNYEIRLNEQKQYTITFGDGIHGKLLPEGDSLIVLFLQSNGESGVIDANTVQDVNNLELVINNMADDELLNVLYGGLDSFKQKYGSNLFIINDSFYNSTDLINFSNIEESSTPESYEDVDSIRINAPKSFATGHRLLSTDDFTAYVSNNLKTEVSSVYTMDNNEYTLVFLKWLYLYDCLNVSIVKDNYKFSDACDFNNIYVWVKGRTKNKLSTNQLQQIVNLCKQKKCATANIVPCNGIMCLFMPFVDSNSNPFDYNDIYKSDWDSKLEQLRIKIVKQQGVYISDGNIKSKVVNIINDYFAFKNTTLGQLVDLQDIYKQIMNIPGVSAVRTVNGFLGTECNGLSFACFSSTVINGKDFSIFTDSKQLLCFQYPQLFQSNIINYIDISSDVD